MQNYRSQLAPFRPLHRWISCQGGAVGLRKRQSACGRRTRKRQSLQIQAGWHFRSAASGAAAAAAAAQEAAKKVAADAAAHKAALLAAPLWQHGLRCAAAIAAGLAASSFISRALHKQADKVQAGEELSWLAGYDDSEEQKRSIFSVAAEAVLLALHRPLAVFVPVVATVLTLRSLSQLLEAVLLHSENKQITHAWLMAVAHNGSTILSSIDIFVRELSEVTLICFIIWSVLRLKERMVKLFMEHNARQHMVATGSNAAQEHALERLLLPLNGLTSWLIVLAGGLSLLHVLGINLAPLLTVGGVSGILVGLSAQSVMANMIAGINLFLSRPFVVGDRIDILTSGGTKFATGFVERVDPIYTVLRTDTGTPVTINNKAITDMVIANESRVAKSRVVTTFNRARQVLINIAIRYQDVEKVGAITKNIRLHLDNNLGIDQRLPLGTCLTGFDNYACNIVVLAHTTPPTSRDFGVWRQNLFIELERIVRKHGAQLNHLRQEMNIPQLTGLEAILQLQQQGSNARDSVAGKTGQNGQRGDMSWLFEESMDD